MSQLNYIFSVYTKMYVSILCKDCFCQKSSISVTPEVTQAISSFLWNLLLLLTVKHIFSKFSLTLALSLKKYHYDCTLHKNCFAPA